MASFVIKTKQRDELVSYLKEKGIQTVINYPVALPFLPAYARKNHKPDDFPCAYNNQSKVLSLPIYPDMSSSSGLCY